MRKRVKFSGLKRLVIFMLCMVLTQGAFTYLGNAEQVQAAEAKSGLKKEGNYYYYYYKNKRVKETWKTIKVTSNGKTVSYRYYFGSNGRAYAAKNLEKAYGYKKNVVLKKIGKYYYAFDTKGRMVKSGYYNDPLKLDKNGDSMTYYIDKNGRYNSSKSKAICKAGAYEANAASVRKILGKPLKVKKLYSCFGEAGDDYQLVYANIYVTTHKYPNGSEKVFGIFPM